MDVRYNFLNTLDHYPCELIRTLWTLQSLDLQQSEPNVPEERRKWLAMQISTQAELLEQLTEERIKALQSHREDLVQLQGIRKRCKVVRKRQRNQAVKEKANKLTIKLNLKPKGHTQPARVQNVKSIEEEPEEKYCFCNNVSYGAMIACDNDNCPLEWFHYGCVGMNKPPNGKWYCSTQCREQAKKRK